MTQAQRRRLIVHSAILLLVGLLFGILDVVDELSGASFRGWHGAQISMFAVGLWLLATASVSSLLVLKKREAAALVLSLLAAGYGIMLASSIEAVTGLRAFGPSGPASSLIAFAGKLIGLFGAATGVFLTLMGARASLKKSSSDPGGVDNSAF